MFGNTTDTIVDAQGAYMIDVAEIAAVIRRYNGYAVVLKSNQEPVVVSETHGKSIMKALSTLLEDENERVRHSDV